MRPQVLRKIAELAFKKSQSKREIADWLREAGVLPKVKDPNDTRGVQEIINEAVVYLLDRDDALLEVEESNIKVGNSGAIFDKYPSLVQVVTIETNAVPLAHWSSSKRPIFSFENPALYTTQIAAHWLTQVLGVGRQGFPEFHVAVSGGITIHQTVMRMRPSIASEAYFYPAAVPFYYINAANHISPETNCTIAWARAGGLDSRLNNYSISPPLVVISKDETPEFNSSATLKQMSEALRAKQDRAYVKHALKGMSSFNLLLTNVEPIVATEVDRNFVNTDPMLPMRNAQSNASYLLDSYPIDSEFLAKDGAVGAINYTFFDENGRDKEEWRLFLTPGYPNSLDFYRQCVKDGEIILVVCNDRTQVPILKIALNAGLFNFLITDSETAMLLLQA